MKMLLYCIGLLSVLPARAQQAIEVQYYAPVAGAGGEYSGDAVHYALLCSAQSSLFSKTRSTTQLDYDEEDQAISMNFSLGANWIYKDNKQGALLNLATSFREKSFLITDRLHPMKWDVLTEKKTIGGLEVQKARTQHRGRNYTAWFAPGIPVSNGPWKLGGLPGLILEAYDDDKLVVFLFKAIRRLPDVAVKAPPHKAQAISMRAYSELVSTEIRQYYDFLNAKLLQEGSTAVYQPGPMEPWEILE